MTTTQLTYVDVLIRVLRDAGRPLTRAQIAAQPACRDWSERIQYNVLRDAQERGFVHRDTHGTYELTDAGQVQLPAELPL